MNWIFYLSHILLLTLLQVKLDVYTTFNAAVSLGKKAQTVTMPPGTCQPIYLTAPSLSDKLVIFFIFPANISQTLEHCCISVGHGIVM